MNIQKFGFIFSAAICLTSSLSSICQAKGIGGMHPISGPNNESNGSSFSTSGAGSGGSNTLAGGTSGDRVSLNPQPLPPFQGGAASISAVSSRSSFVQDYSW